MQRVVASSCGGGLQAWFGSCVRALPVPSRLPLTKGQLVANRWSLTRSRLLAPRPVAVCGCGSRHTFNWGGALPASARLGLPLWWLPAGWHLNAAGWQPLEQETKPSCSPRILGFGLKLDAAVEAANELQSGGCSVWHALTRHCSAGFSSAVNRLVMVQRGLFAAVCKWTRRHDASRFTACPPFYTPSPLSATDACQPA